MPQNPLNEIPKDRLGMLMFGEEEKEKATATAAETR
jgi:hypothetical protein